MAEIRGIKILNRASFRLTGSAMTSVGIYASNGNLVRTLWSGELKSAGVHSIVWDGTDDYQQPLGEDTYTAKVLENNVTYDWEGVIGNTSDNMTGPTKYHTYNIINCMVIVGSYGYIGAGYNEGNTAQFKFNLSTPQQKSRILELESSTSQNTTYNATDGTNIFWGGFDPFAPTNHFIFATKVSDDTEVIFSSGSSLQMTYGRNYQSAIGLITNSSGKCTGLAAYGGYLFSAHANLNQLRVYTIATGALTHTLTYTSARALSVDGAGSLWMATGTSTVSKYAINDNGTLTTATLTLTGLTSPLSTTVNGSNVLVCDGGDQQQIKFFNTSTGTQGTALGTTGGYITDPSVSNSKFYLSDSTIFVPNPFVTFQSNGSFWVSDPGNYRVQHFASDRSFIDRIMYLPNSYSMCVDQNNATRVFGDNLEYLIDYSKPLSPTNGSWTLVRNWKAGVTSNYFSDTINGIFKSVVTLGNGKTYAILYKVSVDKNEVIELPASGQLRLTGILFTNANKKIHQDGSLRSYDGFQGGTLTWKKEALTGFDGSGNPTWSAAVNEASTTESTDHDPIPGGAHELAGQVTSSGVIVSFSGNTPPFGSAGHHLGGIQTGTNTWLWKTAMSTFAGYQGTFPSNGDFDIGNGVGFSGNVAMAIERNIIWGYNGEFWKNSQTNKWNHVYDNGLFIGQFGITGPEVSGFEGPAMMSGNGFSPAIVKVGDDYYLYHNDESYHSGIHRWKITGLNTIKEQTFSLGASFEQSSEAPVLPGIDLMAGLPFNLEFADNTSGWSRYPTTPDYTAYNQYWSAKTNIKTYSKRKSPDLWVQYAKTVGPYFIRRDLGTNIGLSSWQITGQVSYEDNMPNTGSGSSMYLEVLDNAGKIIVRFYNTITFGSTNTINIYANGVLIASGTPETTGTVIKSFQSLEMKLVAGVLSVKYADYSAVSITAYDGTAAMGNPAALRLSFDYTAGALYGKIIDMDQFRFITP